jgi:hypothetical protein
VHSIEAGTGGCEMSDTKFDWTTILPKAEREKVLSDRQAFFDGFPTKEDVEQAGREGRLAFARACAIVDNRNESERFLNAAMDHIAGTLEQPTDQRAWMHLLIYCPYDILEAAYVHARLRRKAAMEQVHD